MNYTICPRAFHGVSPKFLQKHWVFWSESKGMKSKLEKYFLSVDSLAILKSWAYKVFPPIWYCKLNVNNRHVGAVKCIMKTSLWVWVSSATTWIVFHVENNFGTVDLVAARLENYQFNRSENCRKFAPAKRRPHKWKLYSSRLQTESYSGRHWSDRQHTI